jgi:transposase
LDPTEWRLSDDEWLRLAPLLAHANPTPTPRGGRPRLDNDRHAAQACLFRHFHELAPVYHCFGWNQLPDELGISPSTANRRFREWLASGAWATFWDALTRLRRGDLPALPPPVVVRPHALPAGELVGELERAYRFFNDHFFAGTLADAALTVERFWGKRQRPQGTFCPRQWTDGLRELGHIALSTDVLGHGAEATLAVLLHEMVHLRNEQTHLVDCTGPNQYHNRHFRDAALLVGLVCPKRHPRYGYADTALGERALEAVAELRPREELFRWEAGAGGGWG